MTAEPKSRIALRIGLASGPCSIPLHRVHHITGYASLSGKEDDYFLGWLTFHGQQVPVFDLNRIHCDEPTQERFGSRIILLPMGPGASPEATGSYIGLLAAGLTDTVATNDPEVNPFDLDSYLPMLYALIPTPPVASQ
jgi:hypothetical protein